MKNEQDHEFENSSSADDYGHCLVCRHRGFFVSGEWFHQQHLEEEAAARKRHPSSQPRPTE